MAAFGTYVHRTSRSRFTRRAWAAVHITSDRTRREGDRLVVDVVVGPVTFHRTKRAAHRALNPPP